MKKLFFLLLLSLTLYGISAQNLSISFQPLVYGTPIDSILVTNLKTNKRIKLLENESLLLTSSTTNIPLFQNNDEQGYIYPNPSDGDANVFFSTTISEPVRISIYNVSGQLISQINEDLMPGLHEFHIQYPAFGVYLISVIKRDGNINLKAMNSGITILDGDIKYLGSKNAIPLKSTIVEKTLGFNVGNYLHYSIFSGNKNTIMTDSPTSTKVYSVEFFECTDLNNQNYPVVKIGNLWWMAKNLQTTKYNDGTDIPNVKDSVYWTNLETGAFCYYKNDAGYNNTTYGALYNWHAVNTGKLCPKGWHVATDDEWKQLGLAIGMTEGEVNSFGTYGKDQALKIRTTSGWSQYNNGTNTTGFSALPGGNRWPDDRGGIFGGIRLIAYFWTSTKSQSGIYTKHGISRKIESFQFPGSITRSQYSSMEEGMSVRCVKD